MHELTEAFFRTLYASALSEPDLFNSAQLTLWTLPDKKSHHLPLKDLAAVAQKALELDADGKDVYFGVALRLPGLPASQRGGKTELCAVTALWLDIDMHSVHAAHAATNLPINVIEAREILNAVGVPASAVIHSGHGLHAYWFLDEPHPLLDPEQRDTFEGAMSTLQHRARDYASARGWHLDLTVSADRVLRVPGTQNRKAKMAS